ncbi:RpiR family transcriptional regulator [Bacillus freudenreichii]|nr:RpiR family transcriptional regulator [Bacillus freudenreichii]
MSNQNNFLQLLLDIRGSLPKKQESLCNFLIENIQSVGIMTIAELASAANVGTTTVMRLIKNLGYDSYSDVKKELLDATIQSPHNAWWHLQESFKSENLNEHTLKEVSEEGKKLLDETLSPALLSKFDSAIDIILNAKRVNILGTRSNKALALYFGYLLEEFYPDVRQLSFDADYIFDRILRFQAGDILLIIDNAPFTSTAIEAVKFCHENDHPIILITDHLSSEASSFATVTLDTKASTKQYSVMPTIFLLESLIIQLGRKTSNTSITHLQKLSEVLESKNITLPFSTG